MNDKFKVPPVHSDDPEKVAEAEKVTQEGQAEYERIQEQGQTGDNEKPKIVELGAIKPKPKKSK